MSNISDPRITASRVVARGLDTLLHSDAQGEAEGALGSSFSDILSGIMNTANTTDSRAHNYISTMMTGDYDPDMVMLASTKAEMALSLMVQVRDKAVAAYNEILRMQV